jgi:hypothetical protein
MKAIFKSKVFETLPSEIPHLPSTSKRVENFVNNNKAEIKVISVTSAGYDNEVTLWYYEYVYKK